MVFPIDNFIVESPTEFIDQVLKNEAALCETLRKTVFDVGCELIRISLGQVLA